MPRLGEGDAQTGLGADAAAMAELWRSWLGLGSSLGATMPGLAQPGQIAGETLGRFLDPMSLLMASGSQVGETIRKMTEGPRFADLGAIERRMGKVMQLWLQVQQAARAYEAVAAGAWHEASKRFAKEYQKLSRAGQAPKQPNEALKLWLDIANQTLLETHRSRAVPRRPGRAVAPWHDLPAGRARDDREHGRARGPADAQRGRRGPPLGAGAQAPGARAREGGCCGRAATAAGIAAPDTRTQGSTPRRNPGMIPMPTTGSAELMRAAATFNTKVAAGITKLSAITDEQVQIATTPKDEVFKSDKVTLYRYRPLAKRKVATPVLIVYSLIGRYTMTDLQEDRSLIRNLLKQGLDVWVIDWGNASRADRYLTIDDYVLGYLDDCVAAMRRETEAEAVNLLGICEGGAFTLAYAALEPARVKNLVLTVTPLDFHADQAEEKLEHGFINVWTRSLTAEDVDQMIEVWGVLPGEFMGAIFSMLTPIRSMTKYNLDLLEVVDNEAKLINYLRMEKWLADRPHHRRRGRQAVAQGFLPGQQADQERARARRAPGGPAAGHHAGAEHLRPGRSHHPTADVARTRGKVGTDDYTELGLPGGHIGVFVSGKSQGIVGKGIVDWLAQRDS